MTLAKRSLNQQTYRKLVSGQNAGVVAGLLRCLLRLAAAGYAIIIAVRNFLYSRGWLKAHRVDAVVISIGNITTGGTGKTPLVLWLCKRISQRHTCAILTRGYKATKDPRLKAQDYADEVAILAENCPAAKVIVDPDRLAGAGEAVAKFGAKVLIMDDGFQHRRLARELDIVAVDATEPFGYGRLLPAGLLREPLTSLKRADAVVITRCDQVPEAELDRLEEKLHAANPNIVIARSIHSPVCVRSADNEEISVEQLKDRKIFAFCAIGNPDAFLGTIKTLGGEMAGSKVYDDHYHYTEHCLADICGQAEKSGADIILTTQKDWTKISGLVQRPQGVPLAYLAVEIQFVAGQDRLTSLIEATLAGRISQGR
ncbi:MAG: tetraacyldisaccharide 4'-kinase [Planctomycetota bacterium]|jgi:tetraacyldisaccharide 4'-kinase